MPYQAFALTVNANALTVNANAQCYILKQTIGKAFPGGTPL